jgi:Uma2 family endonuclease
MLVAIKKHTRKDYEQLPEGAPYQLIDGELVKTPSPLFQHQKIIAILSFELFKFVKEHALGEVVFAPMDVYLTETDIYQPDIIYISNERSHIIQERVKGVPDLIIEVLSPSNAYYDLVQKKNVYESTGVKEYWIVDPQEKAIEVFENVEKEFKSLSKMKKSGLVESKLLTGFPVNVENIFSA